MSSELEQQLQRALARVEPDDVATEQAKAAALAALSGPGLRSRYRLALLAAALVGALVVTGVTLAASRTAREVVGIAGGSSDKPHHSMVSHGPLPPGSGGFAAYGSGRLWLTSPSLTMADKPYSAVELSPGALNIAVGSGHDLVVRRLSDGGVAWSHHTAGRVVAAAWAPIGTEIAYVVESREGAQLRMIEGDGDHDHLITRAVSAVTPSWRADSLALAYVSAGGQVAVRDLASKNSTHIRPARGCPLVEASQVAFAPRGTLLAASTGDGNMLVADPERGWVACATPIQAIGPRPPTRLAWTSGRDMVAATYQFVTRLEVRDHKIGQVAEVTAPAGIVGLTVSPDRRQIAIGLSRDDHHIRLVVAEMPRTGDTALRIVRTLRILPMSADYSLIWR